MLCAIGWHRRPQLYGHDGRDWLMICPDCRRLGLQTSRGGMLPVNLWDDGKASSLAGIGERMVPVHLWGVEHAEEDDETALDESRAVSYQHASPLPRWPHGS